MIEKYAAADTMWVLIGAFMVFLCSQALPWSRPVLPELKCRQYRDEKFYGSVSGQYRFLIIGFGLMFGTDIGGLIGAPDFFVQNDYGASYPSWAFFIAFKLFSVLRRRLLYQVLWPNGRSFLCTASTVF